MNTTAIAEKFTPGPWLITNTDDSKAALLRSNGELICKVDLDYNQNGEDNAKLIAAAPEMYAALKGVIEQESERGLNDQLTGDNASGHDMQQSSELKSLIEKIKTVLKKATE